MKLIDLLVQELPKRGGWPKDAEYCHLTQYDRHCLTIVFPHRQVGTGSNSTTSKEEMVFSGIGYLGDTLYGCIVTAKEYESALVSSQKPAWNGEGLPPVGCECECQFLDAWHVCKVLFVGAEVIVGVIDGSERAFSVNHTKFRPFQSEAERKRDAAVEAMQREADEGNNWVYSECEIIYDAIAAGKIPGVKLEG